MLDWYDMCEDCENFVDGDMDVCRNCNVDYDFNAAMASLYPDTEYIINKSAYDSGVEGVKEEIIRCKDCEYLVEDDSRWYCSNLEFYIDFVCGDRPDGFCKWGERK